jgi:hypothetical protein
MGIAREKCLCTMEPGKEPRELRRICQRQRFVSLHLLIVVRASGGAFCNFKRARADLHLIGISTFIGDTILNSTTCSDFEHSQFCPLTVFQLVITIFNDSLNN